MATINQVEKYHELLAVVKQKKYKAGWPYYRMVDEFGKDVADEVVNGKKPVEVKPTNKVSELLAVAQAKFGKKVKLSISNKKIEFGQTQLLKLEIEPEGYDGDPLEVTKFEEVTGMYSKGLTCKVSKPVSYTASHNAMWRGNRLNLSDAGICPKCDIVMNYYFDDAEMDDGVWNCPKCGHKE